jgi:hypothetical protein
VRVVELAWWKNPSIFRLIRVAGDLRSSWQLPKEAHMIWFLERESQLLICEIRRADEGETFEFEMAPPDGPAQTRHYRTPTELIDHYLRTQVALQAQGWRPRLADVEMLT